MPKHFFLTNISTLELNVEQALSTLILRNLQALITGRIRFDVTHVIALSICKAQHSVHHAFVNVQERV